MLSSSFIKLLHQFIHGISWLQGVAAFINDTQREKLEGKVFYKDLYK